VPLPANLDLMWLAEEHPEYTARKASWAREERRLAGGDDVLTELQNFDWEEVNGVHHKARIAQALYINLPLKHASTVTGHLRKHAPRPGQGLSFGALGDVRERGDIDTPERAELAWYNLDGIGSDGSSWESWWDAVDVNAQATGHRWIMVEAPDSSPQNYEDELAGDRPFAVEYSPLEVINWMYVKGVLQFAVIRTFVDLPHVEGGRFVGRKPTDMGYYLLVRKGCKLLGDEFAGGGWWVFDYERKPLDGREGTWDKTKGEIPLFPHFGRKARGTTEKPVMSQSDTMELGQLAVSMMNAKSARLFDFWDACASKIFMLGATPEVMKVVSPMYKSSQLVAVPRGQDKDTGEKFQPTVYDGSTGAVVADVADRLEASQWESARQMSMEKVTQPGESGASKDAGFAEASAPDLVRRAMLREQSENTLLYFLALRWGAKPDAYSQWGRKFDLNPLVDEIDATFVTMQESGLDSATLAVELVMSAISERKVITDDTLLKKVRTELEAGVKQKAAQKQADLELFRNARNRPPGTPPGDGTPPPAGGNPPPSNNPPVPQPGAQPPVTRGQAA
jgi:hypothetical protein